MGTGFHAIRLAHAFGMHGIDDRDCRKFSSAFGVSPDGRLSD
jgi:hypothetical protein